LMRTTGTVTTDENGRRCIDWGMPSNVQFSSGTTDDGKSAAGSPSAGTEG